MVKYALKPETDFFVGENTDDTIVGANGNLNAGDDLNGAGGNDTFFYFADATLQGSGIGGFGARDFAAFTLSNVETFQVTNDAARQIRFDLSSSSGLQTLVVSNSSSAVAFGQVTSLANVLLDKQTNVGATDVSVGYQAGLLAGATSLNLTLTNTDANTVTLGTAAGQFGATNAGIETLNVFAFGGSSLISTLNVGMTTLNIAGDGNLTIDNNLVNTVRTINSTVTGNVDVQFNANGVGQGVTFNGSQTGAGVNTISAGGGNDVINTFAGNDRINISQGGNDTVNAGNGSDLITVGGALSAADAINGGANFDVIEINAGTAVGSFGGSTAVEGVTILNAGSTALGSDAQTAGVNSLFLATGGNDVVNFSSFTSGVSVRVFGNDLFNPSAGAFGDDTITAGSGNDLFLVRGDGNLNNLDSLQGGAGFDQLNLEGDTFVFDGGGVGFAGFEFVALESSAFDDDPSNNPNQYDIRLRDINAPTIGNTLFINGSALQANEGAILIATNVTSYNVDFTTGAGNDFINLGGGNDFVRSQGGNDIIQDLGGGNDTIDSGLGDDLVFLSTGNNAVFDEGGNDTIVMGTGVDSIFLGAGDDRIFAGGNLTAADTIASNGLTGGRDTLFLDSSYTDLAFTGTTNIEIYDIHFDQNLTVGLEAQEGGLDTIIVSGAGASTVNAQAFTRGLTVDLEAGGNDNVQLGSGNDLVIAGDGNQTIGLGGGNDIVRFDGSELVNATAISGGTGTDTVQLDNTPGAVTANVNLSIVTGVERYAFVANGDRTPGVDADNNTLVFSNAGPATVGTLTTIEVNAQTLTDVNDTFAVRIDSTVTEADFAFNIFGGPTTTTVQKDNVGTNNNINYQGGAGTDTFIINGNDLGATTIFNGAGGIDTIVRTGGTISDDSYVGVTNVERLTASGVGVAAVLGAVAAASGLQTIVGTALNDVITLDPAFNAPLTFILGAGNDTFNGGGVSSSVTFNVIDANLTAMDTLTAGTGGSDVLQIVASGGTATLAGVNGVETVTIIGDGNGAATTNSTLVVAGKTVALTIDASSLDALDSFDFQSDNTNTGILTVTGGAGNDRIDGGNNNDVLNGGGGSDIVQGGAGNDLINGGAGNDFLRGQGGADTINGGDGDDQISGGGLGDIMDGGAGADIFFYESISSSNALGKDTINNFVSGTDKIDVRGTGGLGATVAFKDNAVDFGTAQSLVIAGDNILDVVFQQDTNTLWVDLNDDGTLNANDLQIFVNTATDALTGADVYSGTANSAADLNAFTAMF